MDIGSAMHAMRDVAGVPAPPVVFQVLMVLTWIFHIAFVHLTLGSCALAIYAFHRRNSGPYFETLSIAMTNVAKIGVSLLIVLGVAPLLFTQVIYDPQWYTSNVLSARWAIIFILSLIVAYCCWFAFYYSNHAGAKRHIGVYAWIALTLFCMDGLIMHVLAYQSLLPAHWLDWYAPNGHVNTSGDRLHAIQWPRYLFVMSLGAPAVGIFLQAYAAYFSSRPDRSAEYHAFAKRIGRKIAAFGFGVSLILLLAWQFDFPAHTGLVKNPVGWLLVDAVAAMWWWSTRPSARSDGYLKVLAGVGVLGLLAIWREVIRINYLAPYNYSVADYPVHMDWPTTILFFLSLIGVFGLVGGYYVTLAYNAGRTQGLYVASPKVARLGAAAVAVLAIWIAVFFAYGIAVFLHNSFMS